MITQDTTSEKGENAVKVRDAGLWLTLHTFRVVYMNWRRVKDEKFWGISKLAAPV